MAAPDHPFRLIPAPHTTATSDRDRPADTIDTVIIGAGQAGLAMSRLLTDRGVSHVVLERGTVANAWRTERWDSLRLLTPNWQSRLPGWSYRGDDPDGYMTMAEITRYLEGYAHSFAAPVMTGTTVHRVAWRDAARTAYTVETDRGTWTARSVVLATGAAARPTLPPAAADLDPAIDQLSPLRYRNPGALAPGGVLVVGASASGVQLAAELRRHGRRVVLAVGSHVRLPRRYRGRDIQWWLDRSGVLDRPHTDFGDLDRARRAPSLQIVGTPDHRTLDLATLSRSGVRLAGRLIGADGATVTFANDLDRNCADADRRLGRLLSEFDDWASRSGLDGDLERPDRPVLFRPPSGTARLDLAAARIRTVIWATGFTADHRFVDLPVFDDGGRLRHDGGVVSGAPGLYALGLPLLRRRRSTFIDGVGGDAAALADHLQDHLGTAPIPVVPAPAIATANVPAALVPSTSPLTASHRRTTAMPEHHPRSTVAAVVATPITPTPSPTTGQVRDLRAPTPGHGKRSAHGKRSNERYDEHYDVVVVGARVAGAATALLLARRGRRVLVVDRAAPGADTLSTAALMRGAVNQLNRWGLLDRVIAAGTPAIEHTTIRYGADELSIPVAGKGRSPLYAPRRLVFDPILADAAAEAGAEVRHHTTLRDLVIDDEGRVGGVIVTDGEGRNRTVGADLVIGADGLRSTVARRLEAPVTRRGTSAGASVVRWVRGVDLPTDRYQWLYGEGTTAGVIPTNDDTLCVFVSLPPERFRDEARHDPAATFDTILGTIAPDVADAVRGGTPVGPLRSWPGHPAQLRRSHGPGWALVGDAGYFKDPAAAHGMSDALRDAELLADAVDDDDLARYERERDELSGPLLAGLEDLASLRWSLEELPAIHLGVSKAMSAEHDAVARLLADRDRRHLPIGA